MCLASSRKDEVEMEASDRASPPSSFIHSKSEEPPQKSCTTKLYLITAVLAWLVTGTTISSLNKWIFAVYNFRYPLLLSSLHMLTAILLDYPILRFGLIPVNTEEEQTLNTSARFKVFLLSLTFCSSIAFGNLGLSCVQLSFAQMIYTTTPIFTLALSKLFLGTEHHALKYTAMIPICLGACFSIIGEVQFDQTGCIYLFASTFLRGLKSIQQSLLLKEENIHSVTLLYLMSIPSFCILLVAAVLLERGVAWERPPDSDSKLWLFILLSCLGSVLYNLASFCVIALTSAVTIHVLGNLNVVGNLVLSRLLFGSHLTVLSYTGIGLTLIGMGMYHNCDSIVGYVRSRRSAHVTEKHTKTE